MTRQVRQVVLLLVICAGMVTPSPGGSPDEDEILDRPFNRRPPKRDPGSAFHQLAELQAGLAYRAREVERDPVKAGLFFLQAARSFQQDGEGGRAIKAQLDGIAAAQPLRAFWVHSQWVVASYFLPGGRQVLTCEEGGRVHVWDIAGGREVRSFQALDPNPPDRSKDEEEVEGTAKIGGTALSQDGTRLLVWEGRTLQLWDVTRERLLRKWDRPWHRASRGRRIPDDAAAVFLPDGKRLLLWGTGKPAEVWDVDGKARIHVIGKGEVVDRDSVSPDGELLLTADASAAYLWDLARGKLVRTLEGGGKEAWSDSYYFSPNSKRILRAGGRESEPREARVFDTATGRRLSRFVAMGFAVWDRGVFSPDGTRVLTWGERRTVQMWDAESGRLLHTFGRGEYLCAFFHHNGTQVLTVGEPTRLWDAKTGVEIGRYGDGDPALFTRDGSRLLIQNVWKHRVEVWDAKTEKSLWMFQTPDSPRDLQLSDDETLLLVDVSSQYVKGVQLWDLSQSEGRSIYEDQSQPRARVFKHDRPVRTAALSRDGARLLCCDEGGRATLWDTAGGQIIRTFSHGEGSFGAAFSPDERRALTWGERGKVKLWETATGKEVRAFDHPADVRWAAFSADGSHVLTRDVDYTVWWWDVTQPRPAYRWEHDREVFGAQLSPDDRLILTWGLEGKAWLWATASGREVQSLAHDGPVFGAAFAGTGRVWTWAADGLREWDVKTGKVLRHQRPPDGIAAAELSGDGKRLLLRTARGGAHLWDPGAAKSRMELDDSPWVERTRKVRRNAGLFNRDGTRALTWVGGNAQLWDLASGVRLKLFRHPGTLAGAAFSRDETRVLTWGPDGTARLWEASVARSLSVDDQLKELEVRSGLQVNDRGELQALTLEVWQERKKGLVAASKKGPQ